MKKLSRIYKKILFKTKQFLSIAKTDRSGWGAVDDGDDGGLVEGRVGDGGRGGGGEQKEKESGSSC